MVPSDKTAFAIAVGAMVEAFGQEATSAVLHGYWLGLSDLTIDQVQLAVSQALRSSKFLPKPVELREFVTGSTDAESLAMNAWGEALKSVSLGPYRHVDFEDKTINAVVRSMGGWPMFVDRFRDTESEKWTRIEFIKGYKAYASRPVSEEATAALPGLNQFEHGRHDSKPVPIRIACSDAPRLALIGVCKEAPKTGLLQLRKV
jgi:hypothetical protein